MLLWFWFPILLRACHKSSEGYRTEVLRSWFGLGALYRRVRRVQHSVSVRKNVPASAGRPAGHASRLMASSGPYLSHPFAIFCPRALNVSADPANRCRLHSHFSRLLTHAWNNKSRLSRSTLRRWRAASVRLRKDRHRSDVQRRPWHSATTHRASPSTGEHPWPRTPGGVALFRRRQRPNGWTWSRRRRRYGRHRVRVQWALPGWRSACGPRLVPACLRTNCASGVTWPMMKPLDAPLKRPSVMRHVELPRPAPMILPVGPSISGMPGAPFGPWYLKMTAVPGLILPAASAG